jgi:hypothetical protein
VPANTSKQEGADIRDLRIFQAWFPQYQSQKLRCRFSLSLSLLSLLSTITCNITKGSLEVKLPTIWRNEEQRWEESERRREEETRIKVEKESEERRCRCAKR